MNATKAEAEQNLEQVKAVLEAVKEMRPEDAHHALTHATQFLLLMTKQGLTVAQGLPLFMKIGRLVIDEANGGSDASQSKA